MVEIKDKSYSISHIIWRNLRVKLLLGSKDLGFYVFRTLICIVGKP